MDFCGGVSVQCGGRVRVCLLFGHRAGGTLLSVPLFVSAHLSAAQRGKGDPSGLFYYSGARVAAIGQSPGVYRGVDRSAHRVRQRLSGCGGGRPRAAGNGTRISPRPVENAAVHLSADGGAVSCGGLAWKAGVSAEVLANARNSIGGRIYGAKIYLDTADLFAWTAVVIVLSVVLERLLLACFRRIPWGEGKS